MVRIWLGGLVLAAAAHAQDATELGKLAPVLTEQDAFVVEGVIDKAVFRVVRDEAGRYTVGAWHATDGFPLFVASGGRAVWYDPLAGEVRLYERGGATFKIRARPGKFDFGWSVTTTDGLFEPDIDLRTLFDQQRDVRIEKGDGVVKLTGRSERGTLCAGLFDPGAPMPCRRIILAAKERRVDFTLRGKVEKAEHIAIPDTKTLRARLGKIPVRVTNVFEGGTLGMAAAAILEPEGRAIIERTAGKVDWVRAGLNYGRARGPLQALFGTGPFGTDYARAGAAYEARDYALAVDLLDSAVKKGDTRALTRLGHLHRWGRGTEKDLAHAAWLFHRAAFLEYAEAQYMLGWMYLHGEGVERDAEKGVFWTRKAAESGHVRAAGNLARAYWQGSGVEKNKDEEIRWTRAGAEAGKAKSQLRLGLAYLIGAGVRKDREQGIAWIRKAVAQGHRDAAYFLGRAYEDSKEVEPAIAAYTKAARKDHADAQFRLGNLYDRKKVDPATAFGWYEKAARKGHAESQGRLGALFAEGRGVERDLALAYAWYTVAGWKGEKWAETEAWSLSRRMLPDELAAAKQVLAHLERELESVEDD